MLPNTWFLKVNVDLDAKLNILFEQSRDMRLWVIIVRLADISIGLLEKCVICNLDSSILKSTDYDYMSNKYY